ncbi:MAG TPA: YkvA family protein [Chloroflexota bacterium]|nr:YkvA family protein [Chloroflexota bacterium]
MAVVQRLKDRARMLKRETVALYLVARDPRTPWYARVLVAVVVGYALSPIDLIPDFIPVLGYLDDLILVPAGIALVIRLVPAEVMADCREQARTRADRPISRIGAAVMISVWLAAAVWVFLVVRGLLS